MLNSESTRKWLLIRFKSGSYSIQTQGFSVRDENINLSVVKMATKFVKYGSFRYNFAEKREKLLSMKGGYSQIGIPMPEHEDEQQNRSCCSYRALSDWIIDAWKTIKRVSNKAYEMGRSDPRKVIFSAKMGLALMLISLLIFLKEPFKDMSRYSVWAILTVVVVFEFSIGMDGPSLFQLLIFFCGDKFYGFHFHCFLSSCAYSILVI